jgi:hypothetical protein
MKRFSIIPVLTVALAVLAASCSKDSPTTPATDDNHVQFKATLLASNETPPITGAESTGRGEATIDFNLTKDAAGAITAVSINYRVDLSGFPAGTGLTAAHIHIGAAGVAGGTVQSSLIAPSEVTFTNGAATFSRLNIQTVTAANAQAIINNPPGYYFNVHSSANTSGVVRGQLVKQ